MAEKCDCCRFPYESVYRVPDAVWAKIALRADGSGLLCMDCCDGLARNLGIDLYWEAAVGEYPTGAPRGDEHCS